MNSIPDQKTIQDFGNQWHIFTENSGYYASQDLWADLLGPLLQPQEFQRKRVAEIGSGTGRIVRMLLHAGADHVTAIEPSDAFAVLQANTQDVRDRITYLKILGEQIPSDPPYDIIVSIGVLHHIPNPRPTIRAAYDALKPGGKMVVWMYGYEGNELYLAFSRPLRSLTSQLPDRLLLMIAWLLWIPLRIYILGCRFLPLPMREYMLNHIGRFAVKDQVLTIFDQLNPTHAQYYPQAEIKALLEEAGFQNIRMFHRHGYSWTAIGEKA